MSDVIVRRATTGDRAAVLALLDQASLPTQDLDESSAVTFWVAELSGSLVGAVGLERHGDAGLLRSLVVAPSTRGRGIGLELVAAIEREAREAGLRKLVLLTQTAQSFFARLGYEVIARDAAPSAVQSSAEFRSLCPASAVCMSKSVAANDGPSVHAPSTRILFLCTGNSCRSILAEATFNHLAPRGWRAMSAGSRPTGQVHPRSLALLAREGISGDGYFSKSWNDLPQTPDIVITVCGNAAGEECPAYLGPVLRSHWGVDDPARAIGTDAEIEAAFESAYRTLRRRIEAFLALPLDALARNRAQLQAELDRIGAVVE